MLKLAKGIKIELLENYGFEKRYDIKTGKISHYHHPNWSRNVDIKKRTFEATHTQERYKPQNVNVAMMEISRIGYSSYPRLWSDKDIDYLYDLIKDGLVIKEEL